jgi:hypothetical protein
MLIKKTLILLLILTLFACTKPEQATPLYSEIDSLVWVEYYKQKAAGAMDTVYFISIDNTNFIIKEYPDRVSVILKN